MAVSCPMKVESDTKVASKYITLKGNSMHELPSRIANNKYKGLHLFSHLLNKKTVSP